MVCMLLMSPNDTTKPTPSPTTPERVAKPWQEKVHELLTRAAKLSAKHGVEVDPFMRGAWSAYVDVRPGLRAYLEDQQLKAQLEQMRESGRIGSA
jgi:hypothetical protein